MFRRGGHEYYYRQELKELVRVLSLVYVKYQVPKKSSAVVVLMQHPTLHRLYCYEPYR